MNNKIYNFDQYFFDCDGVILDSNSIKTEAFIFISNKFSPLHTDEFIEYHQKNGGISRFKKFDYLFKNILGLKNYTNEYNDALLGFSEFCLNKLISAPLIDGVEDFLKKINPNAQKFIVSGGLQSELEAVFEIKGLKKFFNSIHGAPATKQEIMHKISNKLCSKIFFGDSILDYQVSTEFNCQFYFVYGKTEVKDFETIFNHQTKCRIIKDFCDFKNF